MELMEKINTWLKLALFLVQAKLVTVPVAVCLEYLVYRNIRVGVRRLYENPV